MASRIAVINSHLTSPPVGRPLQVAPVLMWLDLEQEGYLQLTEREKLWQTNSRVYELILGTWSVWIAASDNPLFTGVPTVGQREAGSLQKISRFGVLFAVAPIVDDRSPFFFEPVPCNNRQILNISSSEFYGILSANDLAPHSP